MLCFKKGFSYVENITLTGKKLIAGDSESNTYIYVRKETEETFKRVVKKINTGTIDDIFSLSEEERKIAHQLDAKGYFETSKTPLGSFNEVNTFAKIFYKKPFSLHQRQMGNSKMHAILTTIFLVCLTVFIVENFDIMNRKIDIQSLSVFTVVAGILLFPILINTFHELGHLGMAFLFGVPVASLQIGFFITHPIVYLTYRGLNLQTTLVKTLILLGGVMGHMIGTSVGFILLKCNMNSVFIEVWILCNVSMIVTSLSIFSVSDGYFILSTLLGIYNLRLFGYKGIKKIMARRHLDEKEKLCGIIMLAILFLSFGGLYKNIKFNAGYIGISDATINLISLVYVIFLIGRLAWKISKVEI